MKTTLKPTGQIFDIPPHKIRPMPNQPRGKVTDEDVAAKVASMREKGQTDPGKVYRLPKPEGGVEFELIAGETRWRACIVLGTNFRTTIEEVKTELERFTMAVISNSYKEMSRMAWARALDRIKRESKCNNTELAELVSKPQIFVNRHLKLMLLHPKVMDMFERKFAGLSFDNAVKLADLPQSKQLEEVEKLIAIGQTNGSNGHQSVSQKQAGFLIEQSRMDQRASFGSVPPISPKSRYEELNKELQNVLRALANISIHSEATLGVILDECKGDDVSLRKLADKAKTITENAAMFNVKLDNVLKAKGKSLLLKR